eukprot:g37780.t1
MQVKSYCGWSVGKVERIGESEDGQVGEGEILKLVKSIFKPLGLEEAKDGLVTMGMGGGVKVDSNGKFGLVGACREQMLCKPVPKSAFGLPNIEETTS